MIFQFTSNPNFDFITEFSEEFGLRVEDDFLLFPPKKGEGYIRKMAFDNDFRLLLHHYKLKEDFTIIRKPSITRDDLISIFFYDNEHTIDLNYNKERPVKFSRKNESAVQLTTNTLSSVIRFPANSETHYLVIGITAAKLASFLNLKESNHLIESIISGANSFLYFESMSVEMQHILKHIIAANASKALSKFYIRIKAEELLFHLFSKLINRENSVHKSMNNADTERLIYLRNLILADLSVPPVLSTLAATIGMGETRMKLLFKQTFGDSIYNYYQKVRMEEAAFLLKQSDYSVSEVGFELGFTNLSHFSKLFKRYFGLTPKKFATVG